MEHKQIFTLIENNEVEAIKDYIKFGSLNITNQDGDTLLHWAAYCGSLDCLQELIKAGAPLDARNLKERTPLYWTCEYGNLECLKVLIQAGASVNYGALHSRDGRLDNILQDPNGRISPLHRATIHGYFDCVRELVNAGADFNARDGYGMVPYNYALCNKHYDIAQYLKTRMELSITKSAYRQK